MRRELLAVIHGKTQPSNSAQVISELCEDRVKLKKIRGGEFLDIDYRTQRQDSLQDNVIHFKNINNLAAWICDSALTSKK